MYHPRGIIVVALPMLCGSYQWHQGEPACPFVPSSSTRQPASRGSRDGHARVALLAPSPSVSAHVALVAATPVPDSTIGQPPKTIRIRFDQVPDPKFNDITLLDTSGNPVAGGPATAETSDPSVIEVTLKAKLAPGLYTVAWQALAKDGHLTKGNYSFTLASGLGPAPPPNRNPSVRRRPCAAVMRPRFLAAAIPPSSR